VLFRAWRRESNRERRQELTYVRETSKKTPGEEKVWNECDDHVIQRCLTSSGRLRSGNGVARCEQPAVPSLHKLLFDAPLYRPRFSVCPHNRERTFISCAYLCPSGLLR
jgi:hypothetical protein